MLIKRAAFRRLCRARDLLGDVPEGPLTIQDVAAQVEISPFHFTRQFHALFGVTPHQFRIRARLDKAKALLASGHLSVTDVCMEVGFSSLGSFSDLFTRRLGMPPSAYQRRQRGGIQVPAALAPEIVPGCFGLMGRLPASAFRSFREA